MNEESIRELTTFFSKYPLLKYKKSEKLFAPGDDFGGVCFVKSGYFRVYLMAKDKRETSIQMFKPLFYFSLISAITGMKNRHYMETMSPVEVWKAPREDFMKLLGGNLKLQADVVDSFLKKFVDFTIQVTQTISGDAYNKVAGLIYSVADEFGVEKNGKRVIKFKITHKQIASMTGLTRETVTLQMLKLEKDGLVDNDKRQVVVQDMKKLSKMLGYE